MELMKLITGIIDWKFRRFCENLLAEDELEFKISEEISYNGK